MISHNQYAAQYQANNIRRGYNKFADLQAGAGYDDYDVSNNQVIHKIMFSFFYFYFLLFLFHTTNKINQ